MDLTYTEVSAQSTEALEELRSDLISSSHLRGDFLLSSGQRSTYYFDKYLFETKPGILRRVAAALADQLPADADRLAGGELGAVPLVTAVALHTGLPFIIVKKQPKLHGTNRRVEGELYPGERVVIVEDVLTTGSEALRVAAALGDAGAKVIRIIGVIDRGEGAARNIAAAGFEYRSIFQRNA
jgi:orotate phosphoribosyltransferase